MHDLFINNINNYIHFSTSKFGDGELLCISGNCFNGHNCDHHNYSYTLAKELKEAWRFLAQQDNVYATPWQFKDFAYLRNRFELELGVFKNIIPFNTFLMRNDSNLNNIIKLYKVIKNSNRTKYFIGNTILQPICDILKLNYIPCPLINNWETIDDWFNDEVFNPGDICLLSAGMTSKVIISHLHRQGITCLDIGAGFDPLFMGKHTRSNQISLEKAQEVINELKR